MDKISVIVPVYNVSSYIADCLESLRRQTFENFEVLIVNDGSPDNSEEIIKPFLKDKRFRYLKKKNGGLSSARNYGIKHVSGDFISFVDGDDSVSPTYLEELYNTIIDNETDIAVCGFLRVYPNKIKENIVSETDVALFRYPAAWNKLYRRSLIMKYQLLFPEGLWYEDLHFSTRALMMGSFAVCDSMLYQYRQNSSSIMHTYDERIYQIYQVIEEIHDFAKENGVYEDYKEQLEFATLYHVLIGTVFRASFMKDFSKENIAKIVDFVAKIYSKWYNNKYIKDNCSLVYKIFLYLIKHHRYGLVAFLFRKFNRFVNL